MTWFCGFAYSESGSSSKELLLFQITQLPKDLREKSLDPKRESAVIIKYLPARNSNFLLSESQPPSEHMKLPSSLGERMMPI